MPSTRRTLDETLHTLCAVEEVAARHETRVPRHVQANLAQVHIVVVAVLVAARATTDDRGDHRCQMWRRCPCRAKVKHGKSVCCVRMSVFCVREKLLGKPCFGPRQPARSFRGVKIAFFERAICDQFWLSTAPRYASLRLHMFWHPSARPFW